MRNSEERRPAGANHEAAESSNGQADDYSKSGTDQSPLAQMRRRQTAALRLPPLTTGYRDPHFGRQRDGRDVA